MLSAKKNYNLNSLQKQMEQEKSKIKLSEKLIEDAENQKVDVTNQDILNNLDWKIRIYERIISNSKENIRKFMNDGGIVKDCSVCEYKVIENENYVCKKEQGSGQNVCEFYSPVI